MQQVNVGELEDRVALRGASVEAIKAVFIGFGKHDQQSWQGVCYVGEVIEESSSFWA